MHKKQLDALFGDVVEQITGHLHRGDTTQEAQNLHAGFCSRIIEIIPAIDGYEPFMKDIVIAFAGKLQFHDEEALKALLRGTSASQLSDLRSARAVSVSGSAVAAWKHLADKDPESAVIVIALCYRLHAERTLTHLVRQERALEKQHHQHQLQGEPV